MGQAVHQSPELMGQLRKALGINEYDVWSGYMPSPLAEPVEQADGEYGEGVEPTSPGEKLDL